jgi:FMN phosphatase YigB (HAD superfamily)
MANTQVPRTSLKAIVFDVDGTLYRQGPLRRAMLRRLIAGHASRPLRGWRTLKVLRAYRQAQEHLRVRPAGDVATAQIAITCERTELGQSFVVECVERWMEHEPLALLPRCLQPGLIEFLRACKDRGLRLAALSDYPVEAKLRAMGVADFFDVALSAQAAEIGVFKPNPVGLQVTLERLGASAAESLYIGDRVEVDAVAAEAAGIACAILTRETKGAGPYLRVTDYRQLHDVLFGNAKVEGTSHDFNRVA